MAICKITTQSISNDQISVLKFHQIELEDQEQIKHHVAMIHTYLCEHCFVDLFIWQYHYNTEICFHDGFLLVRCQTFPEGEPIYLAPIGQGNFTAALELLQQDAEVRGVPFRLSSITEEMADACRTFLGDEYALGIDEASTDYIYLSEKLQTLSGKKLQSKRNLINRFLAANEDRWHYENITPGNIEKAYNFHLDWCQKNGCKNNDSFHGETCAIRMALDHFAALDLRGGLLYLENKVIAFTLGCHMNDEMFVVQIEKADSTIDGAYQMINQQFVLANCTDVLYVNREEDLGLEGLRKAKHSYYPVLYGESYDASPVME